MKKTYLNPELLVVKIRIESPLMNISGEGDTLSGGSNGEYPGDDQGITLGARDGDFDED